MICQIFLATFLVSGARASQDSFAEAKAAYEAGKYDEAVKLVQKTANSGNAHAQYVLGILYQHGRGVPQDGRKAVEWYMKAADRGETAAANNLGYLYYTGKAGVPVDYSRAFHWYLKAVQTDQSDSWRNSVAWSNLGNMYFLGRGVGKDDAKAADCFRNGAEKGNPFAQSNLGYLYEHGLGVKQDLAQAKQWYEKAAKQGYPFAERNLAVMYETGQGTMRDYSEALKWYTDAAQHGSSFAQYKLGRIYERALGVPRDLVEAYKWYTLASAQGDKGADENMKRLQTVLSPPQIDDAKKRAAAFAPVKAP